MAISRLLGVPCEFPQRELEKMHKTNHQRRWNFCVFCHGHPEPMPWYVPIPHRPVFWGPESDELPEAVTEHRLDRVAIPVCARCKPNILAITRSDITRIVLLSWLIGWHWTWHEVAAMPARYFLSYLLFLVRKLPDCIDARRMTS